MQSDWPAVDQLLTLAKENPAQLEALRLREVERLIATAPESIQRRLRGLQFQIDCKRTLHSSPMGACIELSQMMFDAVSQLNNALQGMSTPTTQTRNIRQAAVLPFTKAV
ncbi:MAG: hypothetical protein RL497_830 [Pseudomonadota bacterium]|jgi:hypothetical protein